MHCQHMEWGLGILLQLEKKKYMAVKKHHLPTWGVKGLGVRTPQVGFLSSSLKQWIEGRLRSIKLTTTVPSTISQPGRRRCFGGIREDLTPAESNNTWAHLQLGLIVGATDRRAASGSGDTGVS